MDRQQKTQAFLALHRPGEPLLAPNPWDVGSATLLAGMGFRALATTSLGVALAKGQFQAVAEDLLENCRDICAATNLPVTLDFEDLFVEHRADIPAVVSTIYQTGAVGFSIEDTRSLPGRPLLSIDDAAKRVATAVEANRRLVAPMVITARAESLLHDTGTVQDSIARLQAYEQAGADVLYAPYIRDLQTMATIVTNVTRPVNVVMGFADPAITLQQLAGIGVSRVSIGAGLCRVALQAFRQAATQMKAGQFAFVETLSPLESLLSPIGQEDAQ